MMNNTFSQFRIKGQFLESLLSELKTDKFLSKLPKQDYIKSLFDQKKIHERLSYIIQQNNNHNEVTFTREEVFALLLLMYCAQIENDLSKGMGGFYVSDMNRIKVQKIFQINKSKQKLNCIENYFRKFLDNKDHISQQNIYFTKNNTSSNIWEIQQKIINKKFQYKEIQFSMDKMEVYDQAVVVDFADKNIGGFSLDSHNLAQEEIMMLIYPEALISMLFIPPMQHNEAVLIENLIKYNDYEGYEATFEWKQEKKQQQIHHLLAIDATPFFNLSDQITEEWINRELLKCFIGFDIAMKKQKNAIISTGKWGCGVFGGDVYLKSIIQITAFLMAAEENNSKNSQLIISTMNDKNLIQFGNQIKKNLHLDDCLNILGGLRKQNIGFTERNFSNRILEMKEHRLQYQE